MKLTFWWCLYNLETINCVETKNSLLMLWSCDVYLGVHPTLYYRLLLIIFMNFDQRSLGNLWELPWCCVWFTARVFCLFECSCSLPILVLCLLNIINHFKNLIIPRISSSQVKAKHEWNLLCLWVVFYLHKNKNSIFTSVQRNSSFQR